MPEASHVYPPDRQQDRKKLLQDPTAKALLRRLIVGPGDPAAYELATSAGRLFQLGFTLLETLVESADPPVARELNRPRDYRYIRRGDRLRLGDTEVWTDLSDGAFVEATLLLHEAGWNSALASSIRSLLPHGLRSAGLSGVLCLLSDLAPEDRARLAEVLSRPTREIRPARLDREDLQRVARALRGIARLLDER